MATLRPERVDSPPHQSKLAQLVPRARLLTHMPTGAAQAVSMGQLGSMGVVQNEKSTLHSHSITQLS